jgi:hypothetical protein
VSTIREQIVAAAAVALEAGRPGGVPAPVRTRIDAPTEDQLPTLSIYQIDERVSEMLDARPGRARRGPIKRRQIDVSVEVLTQGGASAEPDKAADPLLSWASQAMAEADTFGGLADDVAQEIGTKFEYSTQGETSFCRATMLFRIEFQTLADDPEDTGAGG